MSNRQARREFKKAVRGFQDSLKGEWGDWQEQDIWGKTHLGIIPPSGLKRFVFNDRYSVQFYEHQSEWGLIMHLLIRAHDRKQVRSWAELQRIKNELAGEERTAIEVFPPESQLVDEANCYHLWVLPENFTLPFGLHTKNWSS